jgi:hypothetical protein
VEKLREYGLGDIRTDGPPRLKRITDELPACPNCGCKHMAELEVNVIDNRLKGGCGVGHYLGCPACPYASPMVCKATPERATESPS